MPGKQSESTNKKPFSSDDLAASVQEIMDTCDTGLCLVDSHKHLVIWNHWLVEHLLPSDQLPLHTLESLCPQFANEALIDLIQAAIIQSNRSGSDTSTSEQVVHLDDGRSMRIGVRPLMKYPGHCILQISEQKKDLIGQTVFDLRDQRARVMLSSVEDAVILLDVQGKVEYLNLAAESLTGFQNQIAVGRPLTEVYRVYDEVDAMESMLDLEQVLSDMGQQLVLQHREGLSIPIQQTISRLRDGEGHLDGAVLVFKDTSQSRKLAAQLNWQASHDPVTRLYNRAEFDRRLSQLMQQSKNNAEHHCLLYLDVDRFIVVNDNCGYASGDELLRQLAILIKRSIRNSDLLARLGGDEFGILLSHCTLQVAQRIAEKIRQDVTGFRFACKEKSFPQSLSIGMVPIDEQSQSVEQILSFADMACFTAKEEGRNKIHIYHPLESSAAKRHGEAQWVTRIRRALENDLLTLFVQPIVSLEDLSAKAKGHVEVLIRMIDDEGGLIAPGVFIPAAERFGLMPAVDRWVVATVVDFIDSNRGFCEASGSRFFVNLSGHSVCDEEFLPWILAIIQSQDIPTGMLCFELTETAAITNLSSAEHFMRSLQRIGCEFALDDFGSGLSSFGYLKHLPVQYLKIDGAFVKDMLENDIDESMVDAINHIGHVMGLDTIAEFVETLPVRERLRDMGVDYAQGYGVCRPFPMSQLLKHHTRG
jgi:Amt family ammonium transporter